MKLTLVVENGEGVGDGNFVGDLEGSWLLRLSRRRILSLLRSYFVDSFAFI
jgi:hypothetical protein